MPLVYQYEQFNREFFLNKTSSEGKTFFTLKDSITFENISFGYNKSNLIFKNLNLRIKKNTFKI